MQKNNAFIKLAFAGILIILSSCNQAPTETFSDTDIKHLNQAAGLMGQYQYQSVVEILSPIHKKYPANATVTLDLAVAVLNRQEDGDIENAIRLASEVKQQDGQSIRANYLLGILYLYQGQAKQAVGPLGYVVEANIKDAYAEYFYAQSLDQLGEFEAAYAHYTKAAELLPYLRSASYAAAMTARKLGHKQQAKNHLETYKQLKNNPRALLAEYKYTRMGKLAEISSFIDEEKSSQPFILKAVQWELKNLYEFTENHIENFAVIQKLQTKLTTDLILFTSAEQIPNTAINNSAIQLQSFLVTGISHSAFADINNDGVTDAVVCSNGQWQLFLQDKFKNWNPAKIFPEDNNQNQSQCGEVKLFDADHDGDIDIYIADYQGADELFSNNGNMEFRRLSQKWNFKNTSKTVQIIPVDWDHDRDLDILLLKQNGKLELLNNHLLWNYHKQSIEFPVAFKKILVIDSDADGKLELLSLDDENVQLWRQHENAKWKAEIVIQNSKGFENFLVEDFDGDGLQELVVFGERGIRWQPLFENSQSQQLSTENIKQLTVIANPASNGPILLSLEGPQQHGKLNTYFESANQAGHVYLQLQGADDASKSLRSNFQAIGSGVRGRVGTHWILPATFIANSQSGQNVIPKMLSTLGTGNLDFVEIRWPDGVFQTELNITSGAKKISETQRQLSSCPVLFVETDDGYQFISDILGVGGVGFFAEPGVYVESRPWEYFMLPQNLIKPGSNKIRLKITEPMEENTYLDYIQLHRYRLPEGWKMVVDERMGVSAPLPTGEPLFYRNSFKPVQAHDGMGNDVLTYIDEIDNNPAPIGKLHQKYIGLVEKPQQLVLQFPQIEQLGLASKQLGLVIDGWVEYPYSQTVFAAWQAGVNYQSPTIEVLVHNQWQTLHHQLGYPAGMPRTAYFPLTGLPKATTAIRISTNLELYYDAISLVEIELPPIFEKQTARLTLAKMEYIGFPQRTNAASNRPVYNYQKRSPYADMKTLTGDFTRFGEISELLLKEDNAFAIIGSGDSVALEFQFKTDNAQSRKATSNNEYIVLEARGYAKDMDLYTDTGGTVTPIPKTKFSATVKSNENRNNNKKLNHKSRKLHDSYNNRYQDGW